MICMKEDRTMKSIASRISGLVVSKIGKPPSEASVKQITSGASVGDDADKVAFEVCSIICREEGLVLDQGVVAEVVRGLMKKLETTESKRLDRVAELRAIFLAATGAKSSSPQSVEESLEEIAKTIFATVGDDRWLFSKPIKPVDVCSICRPSNITFLVYEAEAEDISDETRRQVEEARELVTTRLATLGLPGDVSVSVVVHRGCCKVHGSESRRKGDGVAEVPGVLLHVDFGCGVEIEKEHEVRVRV